MGGIITKFRIVLKHQLLFQDLRLKPLGAMTVIKKKEKKKEERQKKEKKRKAQARKRRELLR